MFFLNLNLGLYEQQHSVLDFLGNYALGTSFGRIHQVRSNALDFLGIYVFLTLSWCFLGFSVSCRRFT